MSFWMKRHGWNAANPGHRFLLDQLGSSIAQLGDKRLGDLLHPLAQFRMRGGDVGVEEAGEQSPELLVALILARNIISSHSLVSYKKIDNLLHSPRFALNYEP